MAKRKGRRLTCFGKLLLLIIIFCILFCIKYILVDRRIDIINSFGDLNGGIDGSSMITDSSESDNDSIEKIFEEGMSVNDYKKILNQKSNYISRRGNYSVTNYDFNNQLHYSELENIYKNFANSEAAKVEIIGKSVDGRNIYGIEIGNGNKTLFLDANVHAAEIANTLILTRFLNEILDNYENNDEDTINLLKNVKIAVIPCMNPDGYEVFNYGVESINNKNLWWYQNKNLYDFSSIKSNANGVDLNRNFPTQNAGMYFKGKTLIKNVSLEKTTSKTTYFNGYVVGSEPETRAAMYFMLKHYKNVYAYINMHSQGRVIYAGKPNLSNEFNDISMEFARKVTSFTNYVAHGLSSEEVGEGNDGSVTDFMAELANGFVFSSKTGRLSTDKHIDNSCSLKYSYPVITLETIKTYTTDPSIFSDEYYNYGIKDLLFNLLEQ